MALAKYAEEIQEAIYERLAMRELETWSSRFQEESAFKQNSTEARNSRQDLTRENNNYKTGGTYYVR